MKYLQNSSTILEKKARCIYIDLPGTGLSDAPEGIEYTQDLMIEARELKTLEHYPGYDILLPDGDQHVIPWAYHESVNEWIRGFMTEKSGKKY